MKTSRKHTPIVSILAAVAVIFGTRAAAQDLLLYEPFDYPNGEALTAQLDGDGNRIWTGVTGGQPLEALQTINGDAEGDNGTSSLEIEGLPGRGGRVRSTQRTGGNPDINLPVPITGEGSVLYVSFFYKPIELGTSYFAHNNTDGSYQNQIGRLESKSDNDPNTTFYARWRESDSRMSEEGAGHENGTTVFLVFKTTLVPGEYNDTFDLWIDPEPGDPEPVPMVTTGADDTFLCPPPNRPCNADIDPTVGIKGFSLRNEGSTGVFEIDELRMGLTWESVTTESGLACAAIRAVSPQFYLPLDTINVTVSAAHVPDTGTTMITETFPDGWTVTNDGGGTVDAGAHSISFSFDFGDTTNGDMDLSYELTVPDGVCQEVAIAGAIAGVDCSGEVAGVSILRCAEIGGIRISGDEWERFDDIGAAGEQPEIVVTADGLKSLYFPGPDSNAGFILYTLDVTGLPADGKSRFPVWLYARNIGGQNDTSLGIRNLSLDPEPDPGFQDSFVAMGLSIGPKGSARDERWFVSGGTEGEDLEATIGTIVKERAAEPVESTASVEASITQTVNATLELDEGLNLLRIDATDPLQLPAFDPDQGWQAFTLVIGPGETELKGELSPTCFARRVISPQSYLPGGTVGVTVTARNITTKATITETFPDGWTVAADGGGRVDMNTITFDLDGDGEASYELTIPEFTCESASITGTISGEGGCARDVAGASKLECAGEGGITIRGSDWDAFIDVGSVEAPPEILTTVDGKTSLYFPNPDVNNGFIVYKLDVTELPGGVTRFPVQLLARNIDENETSVGIRNLTLDPEQDPELQKSFVAVDLDIDGGGTARDERWETFIEGEDLGTVDKVSRAREAAVSTRVIPPLVAQTLAATVELGLGENLLRIDATDPGDLENFDPPRYVPDQGWQLFRLVIGPDEPDLVGTLVAPAEIDCDNGSDDDGDGRVDCEDPDCVDQSICQIVFKRGDTDVSGVVDISDPIFNLTFQFVGGIGKLPCEDAADVDASGVVDISDPIYNLTFQFVGGIAPPSAPGPTACGPEPSQNDLSCDDYPKERC